MLWSKLRKGGLSLVRYDLKPGSVDGVRGLGFRLEGFWGLWWGAITTKL